MEQVTFTPQPSGLYILNGQAVFIQNGIQNGNVSESTNDDIVQQALNGLSASVVSPTDQSEFKFNTIENYDGQNYVLLDKDESDDGRVVQLSISDDYPLQFVSTSPKKELGNESPLDTSLLKSIFSQSNDSCDNSSSTDLLSSFLKLPPKDNLSNQFELVSPLKGNFTYAYQLCDSTKLRPVSNVDNGFGSASLPTVSIKENNILSDGVTVPTKGVISQSSPLQNSRNLVYVNKILNGVGIKPRLILNMKPKTGQEQKKGSQKIRVVPSRGKSFLMNSPRTSMSEKVSMPAVSKLVDKETVNSPKLLFCKDLKSKNSTNPVSLKSLLKTKLAEHSQGTAINKTISCSEDEPHHWLETSKKPRSESSAVQNDVMFQESLLQQQLQQQKITHVVTASSILKKDQPKNETKQVRNESPTVQTNLMFQQESLLQQQEQHKKITHVLTAPSIIKKEQSKNETKQVGKLTDSQLKKIAAVFQNSCLNRTRLTNSTIFDSETNTRIVCRVVYPEDLIKDDGKRVIKRGKKRTRPVEEVKKTAPEDEKTKKPPPPSARTRSGRLSRPPRYMVKDFKKLTEDSEASYSDYRSDSDENSENTPLLQLPCPPFTQRKISTKFHCPTCGKVYLGKRKMMKHFSVHPEHKDSKFELDDDDQENAKQQENERNLWKKIFRKGARKPKLDSEALLKELFHACSNEQFVSVAKERIATHVEPWDYLKTRQLREGGGVRTLLTDLSSLIKAIPKNLLHSAQPGDLGSIHIQDEKLCQLLNISPGHYLPNESALKREEEIKDSCEVLDIASESALKCEKAADNCWVTANNKSNESPVKMELGHDVMNSVDDVSKEVSSELNEILLDKSLDSVDQIVSERLNDLIPASPLDVSSLVEAQVLARSILSSSPDLLHGVSGSTEDLMKTLENLTPDLPSDSTSADFDFAVLASDFSSDR